MNASLAGRFGLFSIATLFSFACSDQAAAPGPSAGGSAGTAGASPSGGIAGQTSTGGVSGSGAQSGGAGGMGGVAGGAGTSGTGGASGAGTGGAAGAGGSGGASPAVRSAGCGTEATQQIASWSERPRLDVNGDDRQWWVWLPAGYDPMRAYPVVFTLHGCGGPDNHIPIQEATVADAIVVRGSGSANNGCWTYGLEGNDVKFFDAMLAALQAQYCMDTSRVFSIGFSSGAWMTNTLECSRGDKLRATGTVSGGRAHNGMDCKGKFARATVHDRRDGTNPFEDWQDGNVKREGQGAAEELDRVIAQNHCMAAPPIPEDPAPCARYQGCDPGYPVIACMTEGKGHDRQDDLNMEVFWKMFSSL